MAKAIEKVGKNMTDQEVQERLTRHYKTSSKKQLMDSLLELHREICEKSQVPEDYYIELEFIKNKIIHQEPDKTPEQLERIKKLSAQAKESAKHWKYPDNYYKNNKGNKPKPLIGPKK